jgi:hypothetical protein
LETNRNVLVINYPGVRGSSPLRADVDTQPGRLVDAIEEHARRHPVPGPVPAHQGTA